MAGKKKNRKKARGKTKPKKDPLADAVKAKVVFVTVEGKKLSINKWSLRMSLRLGSVVADIVKKIAPTGELSDLLLINFHEIVAEYEDEFISLLVESLMLGDVNFEDQETAEAWVEELDAADALEVFAKIAELNLRPLMQKVLALNAKLKLGPQLTKAVG